MVSSLNVFYRDTLPIVDLGIMAWFLLVPDFLSRLYGPGTFIPPHQRLVHAQSHHPDDYRVSESIPGIRGSVRTAGLGIMAVNS